RHQAVRELDLFDVRCEERCEVVADGAGFKGRKIAPRSFEILQTRRRIARRRRIPERSRRIGCPWSSHSGSSIEDRRPLTSEFREIFLSELHYTGLRAAALVPSLLQCSELDAANLSGDGLWQLAEFDAPNALVRRQPLAHELEDGQRRVARR